MPGRAGRCHPNRCYRSRSGIRGAFNAAAVLFGGKQNNGISGKNCARIHKSLVNMRPAVSAETVAALNLRTNE